MTVTLSLSAFRRKTLTDLPVACALPFFLTTSTGNMKGYYIPRRVRDTSRNAVLSGTSRNNAVFSSPLALSAVFEPPGFIAVVEVSSRHIYLVRTYVCRATKPSSSPPHMYINTYLGILSSLGCSWNRDS